jgi:hypothetical protein
MPEKLFVIDDSTGSDVLYPKGFETGLEIEAPGYGTQEGYAGVAEPFPSSLLFPRSEWQARIAEQTERRSDLTSIARSNGVKVKNQRSTNFCWIFGPTLAAEMVRAVQNQPHVSLSPASAGSLIKNFRNQGGWGREGLQWIVDKGVAPSEFWPDAAIDRRYATPENAARAMNYRVDEWWVLQPRNHDQVVACLLRGIPVSVGFNWWGHQVTYSHLVWRDGVAVPVLWNSWSESWGTGGLGELHGSRMLADDAVAPRTALPS